jgi:glutamate racemase
MGKIAVFDSGLGSLSIILAIRKVTKADIVYFADQKNYPYGKKSYRELRKIIQSSIEMLREKFKPDVIVVGSNTPSLLFPDIFDNDGAIVGVFPPLTMAQKTTKTKSIAILGTTSTIQSKQTSKFIKKNLTKNIRVHKIDSTILIDLVESGKFIYAKQYCQKIIKETLTQTFMQNNIDVVTLSSTHLPFLLSILRKIFPKITFLDPALQVATCLQANKHFTPSTKNSLQIFSSSDIIKLNSNLKKLKIKNKVRHLEF